MSTDVRTEVTRPLGLPFSLLHPQATDAQGALAPCGPGGERKLEEVPGGDARMGGADGGRGISWLPLGCRQSSPWLRLPGTSPSLAGVGGCGPCSSPHHPASEEEITQAVDRQVTSSRLRFGSGGGGGGASECCCQNRLTFYWNTRAGGPILLVYMAGGMSLGSDGLGSPGSGLTGGGWRGPLEADWAEAGTLPPGGRGQSRVHGLRHQPLSKQEQRVWHQALPSCQDAVICEQGQAWLPVPTHSCRLAVLRAFCANKLVWEENSMGQNTTKHKTAQTQSWGRQGPSDLPEAKFFKKDQRRESAPEWAA